VWSDFDLQVDWRHLLTRRHHRPQVLCSRLLAIEYIDLAEQSLQALEKLSHEHPQVIDQVHHTLHCCPCLSTRCTQLPSASGRTILIFDSHCVICCLS
jgi:hypothetical protein